MESRGRAAVASIFVLAAVGGCGGGEHIVAPLPSNLTIASGNNQRVTPGGTLPAALEVAVTNSDGRASVDWTLGSRTGSQSVEAIVVAVASPALFSATAATSRR